MYTLGINAAFHDSSACLIKNGTVIAAAEEERFTHVKHGKRPLPFSAYELPFHAINYCLEQDDITLKHVEHIAYGFDPNILIAEYQNNSTDILTSLNEKDTNFQEWFSVYGKWDTVFLSSIINAPKLLTEIVPLHLQKQFRGISKENLQEKWHFIDHHIAHAASAFYPSPFEESAILTIDGRGEIATTTYGIGQGNEMKRIGQVNIPNSLGIFYEEFTDYLGFLRSSDEYKVMALASFGKPTYKSKIQNLIDIKKNGQYVVKPFDLIEMFGPKRLKGEEMTKKHYDIAHSLQAVLEETVLELAQWLAHETKLDNLCMAGGVALNCVMNAKIRDKKIFKDIWVQPAAGDAGTSLGAALWYDHQDIPNDNNSQHQATEGVLNLMKTVQKVHKKSQSSQIQTHLSPRTNGRLYQMNHVYLGPSFSDNEIEKFLTWSKLSYRKLDNIPEETAKILANDNVIGWYHGRMEFGPRALGARSILASPIHAEMQQKLNEIKDREDFRPVAPVVIEEEASKWFRNTTQSPFMLFVFDVLPDKTNKIPAVKHIDGTARIQTINKEQNHLYYSLLQAFFKKTNVPILVNTSFNTRGEPIVCTPRDAIESYLTSPLDALVIGSFLLEKKGKNL